MTDDRPAQPGPPGDPPGGPPSPPNPPGGQSLEERVAVVEARLNDLPTKGDLAKGLAKTERRMSRKIDKVSERLTEKINEVSERLNEKLHRQVLIYLGVVGFAVGSLIGFQEWRDRERQQQIQGVQQQIQGVQQQIEGVQNQIQGMQQQINLLLEHLLGDGDARPKAPQGGEPQPRAGLQRPGGGEPSATTGG